jgi:hypothetical protein
MCDSLLVSETLIEKESQGPPRKCEAYPQGCLCEAYPQGPQRKCEAYRKDHRRCHKTAFADGLCEKHQTYYKNWFNNRPPIYGYNHLTNNRLYSSYKEQLSSGRITITPKQLNSLGNDINNIDYFLLLCSYVESLDPLWNQPLFTKALEVDLLYWIRLPSKEAQFINTLTTVARNPQALLLAAYIIFRFCMRQLMDYYTFHDEHIETRLEIILEKIFAHPLWNQTFYSAHWDSTFDDLKELIKEDRANTEYNADEVTLEENFLYTIITPLYKTMRETQKVCIESALATYKEELMAAAWHPRRVEVWWAYFGEDVFEKI